MNQTPMEKPQKNLMEIIDELDGIRVGDTVSLSNANAKLIADNDDSTPLAKDPCVVTSILPNWKDHEYGVKDAEGRLYACSRDELGSNAGRI